MKVNVKVNIDCKKILQSRGLGKNGAAARQGCLAAGCPQRGFVLRYENGREGMTFPGGLFRSGFGFFWLSGKLMF